jgi:DNA polymerase-3 subunit gamma/tau
MSKNSLYLKFRPSQLDEIVGQKPVVSTLKKAFETNKFAHAYLFSGNHGCGKTTTARILATLINCEGERNPNGLLCGKCRACTTILSCSSIDLIEIDGASNRGIDNIKSIIDASRWAPNELRKKVFIIDECHQLSKEAISALLKTLEEPNENVLFILCTTDIHKILPTILSRCQRFNFTKIQSKDIAKRLYDIAEKEKIIIDEAACFSMAKMARGSMRDAIGYLEQLATVADGKKITEKETMRYFGLVDRKGVFDMVNSILEKNISLLMDQINDIIMSGVECKQIVYEISEVFRGIMVMKAQSGKTNLIDLPDYEIGILKKMGEALNISKLIKLSHLFADIDKKMSFNINERWIAEATLINCIALISK